MKNKLRLLLFFSFCSAKCFSQAYHPLIEPNKYWQVFKYDPTLVCLAVYANEYFFSGDTVINGTNYNILKAYPVVSLNNIPYFDCPPYAVDQSSISPFAFAFLREDTAARKVYILDQNNNTDELYMDFSLTDGDTLFTNFQNPNLVLDSVRPYQLLDGTQSKIFYFPYGITYIEGIGPYHGLRMFLVGGWLSGAIEVTSCVLLNNTPLYSLHILNIQDCLGVVGIQHLNLEDLSIKNFGYQLAISSELDDLEMIVYDTNGGSTFSSKLKKGENNFSLENFSAGCYLVKVFNEKEQVTKVISVTR